MKQMNNNLFDRYSLHVNEAGCDEAGRGCLSGSVFAAAVILPLNFSHPLLNDSKKMSESSRELLRPIIEEFSLAYAVGICTPAEIDSINILNASILAMHRALSQLSVSLEQIIVDGNRFKPFQNILHTCIVKGDSKYKSIAAASVLAKTYRDDYMRELHLLHPEYGWDRNKGYPTKDHCDAIDAYGVTEYHRKSFRYKKDKQLKLLF